MEDKVLKFISRFTAQGSREQVIDTFKNGCCYWFASALFERFAYHEYGVLDVELVYDEVINHFGCRIEGKVYDITGDVTVKYSWKEWWGITDTALKQRIVRDCIAF